MHVDTAIVGDGLIGLSTAIHLRRRGVSVAVIGGSSEGQASHAAVGMLTPACEYDPWMPAEFYDLLREGLDYYPRFLDDFGLSPESVGYRSSDFTLLDLAEREESVQERIGWMDKLGIDCRWLDRAEVCGLEPGLTPVAFNGAIRIKGEAVVNPRALLALLKERLDGALLRGGLTGVVEDGSRFRLTAGASQEVVADRVVIAAGSWSGDVGRRFGLDIPVCPVKGQIIRLTGTPGAVDSVIFMPSGGCGSIVERSPGEYIVGTSEEYLQPTTDNTAGVIGAILNRLCTVLPAASEWRIEETWSGFRPMTSDELPIIGFAQDDRIVVATGHHRNGILLTTVTGRLVADLLDGEETGVNLSRYGYGRRLRPHTRFATKY
ncbi:NAD(P)/FAD-dependent oxidoreductase [Streptomyces sp. SP17KL33]|uniref:NAD(P)/FAD-dependent oxidoreductase n=1 Tax=Streptomyces sp. SP17KL33 TaxID=3002534 RepID=UPI002E7A6548|nr:FAD-dependent oxidoreductase [Streptomyces sp. SP17KL33]MEE1831715.1 FAD-dependent oxidoreductase [Streptomyces sp. SP17KL33]